MYFIRLLIIDKLIISNQLFDYLLHIIFDRYRIWDDNKGSSWSMGNRKRFGGQTIMFWWSKRRF